MKTVSLVQHLESESWVEDDASLFFGGAVAASFPRSKATIFCSKSRMNSATTLPQMLNNV